MHKAMNLSYLQNTFFSFLSLLSFYSKPIHILLFLFFLKKSSCLEQKVLNLPEEFSPAFQELPKHNTYTT